MSTPRIDKTWTALEKTERELYHHFEGIRRILPHISKTPEPQTKKRGRFEHRGKCYYGGLLNNMNTPSAEDKRFATLFKPNFELVSFTPAREVVGKPRPLAYRIIDPHAKSNGTMRQFRTPHRPLISGFKSTIYLGRHPSRCTSNDPTDTLLPELEVLPGKLYPLLEPFPLREHKRTKIRCPLKLLSPIAFPSPTKRTLDTMQTRTCKKLEIRLEDDEDEDKIEPFDPMLLPKYE